MTYNEVNTKNGLAIGASFAIILINLWLNEYEPVLNRVVPHLGTPIKIKMASALNVKKSDLGNRRSWVRRLLKLV